MCGIAGWFEARPECGPDVLAPMLRAMRHRGPDGRGVAQIRTREGGQWLLGACRLAILDLTPAADQPMCDQQTGNWLVYNGEIYNFRELREELQGRGCAFSSQGDTEVLLLGYRVWGAEVVSRLRGMFAFGVWDEAQQTLHLVRDRHGIKPLYFYRDGARMLFASELRALLASGKIARELDATGLDSYLKFGAVQEPATLIRHVRMLPAGHCLRWSAQEVRQRRYWSLPGPELSPNGTPPRGARVRELGGALAEAVGMRLVSDVPLGIFLSGGLDSTVVTCLAARNGRSVKTFSINFAEKQFAEGAMARRVAAWAGTEHTEITVSESDLLAALPAALAAMDQPTVDGINTFFVSRATKAAGVTVALSGLGGDELFAGYRSFRLIPRMELADRWLPQWTRQLAASLLESRLLGARADRKLCAWLRQEYGFAHPFYLSRMILVPARVARLLEPEWLLAADYGLYAEEWGEFRRLLAAHDSVNRIACLELGVYMRNMLLRDTDFMSMAHSLEVRVPLLDHRVTEAALLLPGAWKLDAQQRKPLLLAALERPLPPDIRQQPKRGFEFPFDHWLRSRLRPEVESAFAEPGALAGVLRWRQVQWKWNEFLAGRMHWSRPWMLYVLRQWCEANLRACPPVGRRA
jgi:asparagine synthase (glutamine-hydrolysing)